MKFPEFQLKDSQPLNITQVMLNPPQESTMKVLEKKMISLITLKKKQLKHGLQILKSGIFKKYYVFIVRNNLINNY